MSTQPWRLESADLQPGLTGSVPQVLLPTVLLVEDDGAVRDLLVRLLQRHGYHVTIAADGLVARDLALQQPVPFDLLLTDVIMPNLNGVELAQALRAQGKVKAVLLMTGFADNLLDALPGEHVLYKPFAPATLLAWIEQLVERIE